MPRTLKQLRQERGLTQEQLAIAAGTTQGSLSQWETGVFHPRLPAAARLAKALGVTTDEIITAITIAEQENE